MALKVVAKEPSEVVSFGWRNKIAVVRVNVPSRHSFYKANYDLPFLGALAPLASVTAVRTVSFSIYQKAKYKYSATIGQVTGLEEPLVVVNKPGSVPTLPTAACFFAAGATAGSLITVVACTSLHSSEKYVCLPGNKVPLN